MFFSIFSLFLGLFGQLANAQGNVAILVGGTSIQGELKNFEGLGADSQLFPGIEVRFNEKGRVAFGVSYQRWRLNQDPVNNSIVVDRNDEKLLVSWDESAEANGSVFFTTLYVNLLTRGKVRPFIGGGPGFAMLDVSSHMTNIVDVNPPFFVDGGGDKTFSESQTKILAKGVAGVNIYPAKHLVLSVGGGYINGPAISFGAGVTF